MAERDKVDVKDDSQLPVREPGMTESSPNPHNEADIAEVPVRTDHSESTKRQNVAQTPSTTGGRLHPSVAAGASGAAIDSDSMFNNADPQTTAAEQQDPDKQRKAANEAGLRDRGKHRRPA